MFVLCFPMSKAHSPNVGLDPTNTSFYTPYFRNAPPLGLTLCIKTWPNFVRCLLGIFNGHKLPSKNTLRNFSECFAGFFSCWKRAAHIGGVVYRVKPQGGAIPKRKGPGWGGSQIYTHILGMSWVYPFESRRLNIIMNLNVPRLQGIGQFLHYSLRVGRTQFLTATH
jgi:hypothetical protein